MGGVDAWAVPAADAAAGHPFSGDDDALLLLSQRGTKLFTSEVLEHARVAGVPTVVVSKGGNPDADLETVSEEVSSAFTASHLGALMRVAQLAERLRASLGALHDVPDAVARELAPDPVGVTPSARLLEFAGVGINAWTAAEGALKIRETALVATEGLACESILHGPAVALGADDSLVCLDSGTGSDRLKHGRCRESTRHGGKRVRASRAWRGPFHIPAHGDRAEDRRRSRRDARRQPRQLRSRPNPVETLLGAQSSYENVPSLAN
jgi:fructoselysine-6-P-deglycase FrlB-like protein